jgi:hypothetical protein
MIWPASRRKVSVVHMADLHPIDSDQARNQFEIWLPWYVNGTLDAQQRRWVEAYLKEHPAAGSELAWLLQLQGDIQVIPAPPTSDLGLERTLARIRSQPADDALPASRGLYARWSLARWLPTKLSLMSWRSPIKGPSTQPSSRFAWIACAVIVFQSGLLLHYRQSLQHLSVAQVRSQQTAVAGVNSAVIIRLTFNVDTREEDIRLAIASVDGRLVGGPGRMGDYYIASEISADLVLATLRNRTFVESITEVGSVPPRD